jgi:recombination protein RecR
MLSTSPSLDALIAEFSKLPGIGRKTAQRLALFILKLPKSEVERMARALLDVKDNVRTCSTCCNITETDPCVICSSSKRDRSIICVVEESNDVFAIERTNDFKGLYHVLGGSLSPLESMGPEDLRIRELLERCVDDVREVILAMNPNIEGEATTLYLSKLLKPLGVVVSRIARGIPVGSDLEFTDSATISRAIEGRLEM